MKKFLRVLKVLLPFKQLSKPGKPLDVAHLEIFALFVTPVRRDPLLRDPVHLMSPDLNFDALTVGTDHAGMKRLVHVRFWQGDIILESSWNGPPL